MLCSVSVERLQISAGSVSLILVTRGKTYTLISLLPSCAIYSAIILVYLHHSLVDLMF